MLNCGISGIGDDGGCGGGPSKSKVEGSGSTGVFGGEDGGTLGSDSVGMLVSVPKNKEASRLMEAGGAEGSVGDGALVSATGCWLAGGTTGTGAEVEGAFRSGDVGVDTVETLVLVGEVRGRKTGHVGGDAARVGEGGAREKGEKRGELSGEVGVLACALEKMKAVSVRLRWYRRNGLPEVNRKVDMVKWQLTIRKW